MSLGGAGGGGFGEREGDPDGPWSPGKVWEGVCRGEEEARIRVSASIHGRGIRLWAERARARRGPDSRSAEALF